MRYSDDTRLQYLGMTHDQTLEFDRRDPLTAGLHQVLGAVNNQEDAVFINHGDIACTQPAIHEFHSRFAILVVCRSDPRAAYLYFTITLVVPGDLLPRLYVDHAEIDTRHDSAGPCLDAELLSDDRCSWSLCTLETHA